MASFFQSPRPSLRVMISEILYNLRTMIYQSSSCTPLEAQFGRKPNTTWDSSTRAKLTDNITWKFVLFSLDRIKKMFTVKIMQDYGKPDDATNMGTYDRIKLPLEPGMSVPKSAEEATSA